MQHFANAQHLRHHAFSIEAEAEEGVGVALEWVARELGMSGKANPDIVILKYGLFSVEDARRVGEVASQMPVADDTKVIIIAAPRVYREAQNALLKLFEEPPAGTYLFLVLPNLGGLLPTVRSRVHILKHQASSTKHQTTVPEIAQEFLKGNRERRSAIVKKLLNSKGDLGGESSARWRSDEALALVNGIEAAAYARLHSNVGHPMSHIQLLEEIQVMRGYLHERSAPVRMILEHLSLVTPKNLL